MRLWTENVLKEREVQLPPAPPAPIRAKGIALCLKIQSLTYFSRVNIHFRYLTFVLESHLPYNQCV